MDKSTKVTLTEAWWKGNKPRTLKEKGNFTRALKDFDALWKVSGTVKGPKAIQITEKALEPLDAVGKAAAATASGCVKGVHDGARHVLTKTLPAEAARCRKVLEKRIDDVNAQYDKITVGDCLKDRTLYGHLHAFAKSKYWDECTEFLVAVTRPSDAVYQKYIPESSPRQVNISYATRVALTAAFEQGNVRAGPWDRAKKEITQVVTRNTELNEFRQFLRDRKVAV